MKLKKLFSILLVSASLMTVSQSAFADVGQKSDAGTVTPTVAGIGDSVETAITLIPGQFYDLYLSSASDKDWFKWKNTSNEPMIMQNFMNPSMGKCEFELSMFIEYASGRKSDVVYAHKPGGTYPLRLSNFEIPSGATVYFSIGSTDKYVMEQYSFLFTAFRD